MLMVFGIGVADLFVIAILVLHKWGCLELLGLCSRLWFILDWLDDCPPLLCDFSVFLGEPAGRLVGMWVSAGLCSFAS